MKTGLVLLNMGGPNSPGAVKPFLYNLFSDRDIIRLGPWFLQRPLAWWIAKKRAPKSEAAYRLIGGKSPLTAITEAQAKAVQQELSGEGIDVIAAAGMRYWAPRTPDVLHSFKEKGISRVMGLSLYPHYSRATSGSSLKDFNVAAALLGLDTCEVTSFPDYQPYIDALAECIKDGLKNLFETEKDIPPGDLPEDFALVYSAHSLPRRFIDDGDPYVDHIHRTLTALQNKSGIKGELSFQSRSGPVEWLEPATDLMLSRLSKAGKRRILVLPISFVSDHIETLYEIDMLYTGIMAENGTRLVRTPSLNIRPAFIRALSALVQDGLKEAGWQG
jgi:ferrochelatase